MMVKLMIYLFVLIIFFDKFSFLKLRDFSFRKSANLRRIFVDLYTPDCAVAVGLIRERRKYRKNEVSVGPAVTYHHYILTMQVIQILPFIHRVPPI